MPRPSEQIQKLMRDSRLFNPGDVHEFGRWLDSLDNQSEVVSQVINVIGPPFSDLDSRYLKLTADNDPLTGPLDITTDDAHALRVLTEGTSGVYSFPVTPILDTFPVDGGPPPDANWTTPATAESGLVVDGGKLSPLTGTNFVGQAVWSPLSGLTDTEVYVDTIVNPSAIYASIALYARIQDPDDLWAGSYGLYFTYNPPGPTTIFLGTFNAGMSFGTAVNFAWTLGDSIGLQVKNVGTSIVLRAYHKPAGGSWSMIASGYGYISGGGGFNYTSGKIGIEIEANDSAPDAFGQCDNFGGGQVPAGQYSESVFNVDTLTHLTTAERIEITQPDGIAPLLLSSETLNTHFNADLLDNKHGAAYQLAGNYITQLTGDVLATGPGSAVATLKNTGPGATGPLGSATVAPIITIDAQGRVTALSSATIAGVTPVGAALTRGSLYRGSAANVTEALAHGIAGAVLTGDGTDTFWSTFALAGTAAQTYTFPAAGGTIALGAGTLTNVTTNDVTGATHTHAITSSSDVSAGASAILRSNAGELILASLNILGSSNTKQLIVKSNATQTTSLFEFQDSTGAILTQMYRDWGWWIFNANQSPTGILYVMYDKTNPAYIGSTLFQVDTSTSRVMVGAGTPLALFHVNSIEALTNPFTQSQFRLSNTLASSSGTVSMMFTRGDATAGAYTIYSTGASGDWQVGTLSDANYTIREYTSPGYPSVVVVEKGNTADTLHLKSSNVGINVASPTSPIHAASIDTGAGVRVFANFTALGSGANGDGGAIALLGKSSTTAATSMAAINWLYSTATHASLTTKIALQNRTNAGALTDRIAADGATITLTGDVNITGDTWWTSAGGGLPLGSFYGLEINQLQNSAAQNTWYLVSMAAINDGQLNLVTHDGSGKLTMSKAGLYLVNWSMTLEANANNKHLAGDVAVNGTVTGQAQAHIESVTNQELVIGGTAILSLAANATVELAFRTTDTGTPNINVDDVNLSIVQIGA